MKKFSSILKESIDIEELEDYFLLISDTLHSKAEKQTIGKGDFIIYQFKWKLNFNISEFNSVDNLDMITKCLETIHELKTSQKRIEDYDIDFKIDEHLSVRLTPRQKSSGSYKFIIGEDWREIKISYVNLVKFFKDHGYRILKIEEDDDSELTEMSSLYINTNAPDDVCREFIRMFNLEFELEDDNLNRIYAYYSGNGRISINPEEEKTYVVLAQK